MAGFGVTTEAVHPNEKRGVFWAQYKHPATNLSEIAQLAKDYPNHSVGVVGKCRIGHICIFDSDAKGVLERTEHETGHALPQTYTVQSQPNLKPWKKHLYFKHTPYSYKAFGGPRAKEISVRDLSAEPDEKGNFPPLFDLKGSGQGGFVVAEGCLHKSGDTYTGNGCDTYAPIPDFLVDWILKELRQYRSESAKLREKVKVELATAVQARATGDSKPVSKDHVKTAIKSRVGSFASLGIRKKDIPRLVENQIKDFMEDGVRLAEEYKEFIRKEVANPNLKFGKLRAELLPKPEPTTVIYTPAGDLLQIKRRLRPHEVMDKAIGSFPPSITTSEARAQLKGKDRTIQRALRRHGYKPTRTSGNDWVWSKDTPDTPHSSDTSDTPKHLPPTRAAKER
jgi:hypothetical protein